VPMKQARRLLFRLDLNFLQKIGAPATWLC
jgi:hypothetical protein